jgi:hypothetical protein
MGGTARGNVPRRLRLPHLQALQVVEEDGVASFPTCASVGSLLVSPPRSFVVVFGSLLMPRVVSLCLFGLHRWSLCFAMDGAIVHGLVAALLLFPSPSTTRSANFRLSLSSLPCTNPHPHQLLLTMNSSLTHLRLCLVHMLL